MKIHAYDPTYNIDLSGAGGVVASTYTSRASLGSNTPLVESGAGSPGSGPQAAAWDHVHPAAAGAASSFGSNSTRVSSVSAAGASSSNSRADHVHDGIGTVTASGSNTLNRGTVNLRAGTGIALALSNTDGGTGLDTVTITNIIPAGSGGSGGSGAPTSSKYVTTAADATLSNEIVIPGLAVPDRVPSSPNANDDEFESYSGWTNLGSPTTAAVNWPSHLRLKKTNVGLQIHGIYKTAPSVPYAAIIKISDYTTMRRGDFTNYGIAIGDSTPTAWMSFTFSKFSVSVTRDTWTNNTTRASSSTANSNDSIAFPPYLMIAVNSSSSVHCWFSQGGLDSWVQSFSGVNPGFTPSKIGIVVEANGQDAEMSVDYIRFYTGTAGQTFDPVTRTWA